MSLPVTGMVGALEEDVGTVLSELWVSRNIPSHDSAQEELSDCPAESQFSCCRITILGPRLPVGEKELSALRDGFLAPCVERVARSCFVLRRLQTWFTTAHLSLAAAEPRLLCVRGQRGDAADA